MSNFNDKDPDRTQFRADQTVVRPTPGRRGAAATTSAPLRPGGFHSPMPNDQYSPMPNDQYSQVQNFQVNTRAANFHQIRGLNPMVSAASTLLMVLMKLRTTFSHQDINGLYQWLANEIKAFEARVKMEGERPEIVLAAKYVLCTSLDEAVLNTPWGSESGWAQRTLLSHFHNEMVGGEKFFLILDRMRETPAENLNILELMYLCLSLGFQGKYMLIQNGKEHLETLREELFRVIRNFRGEFERELSPHWQSRAAGRRPLVSYFPFWVIASTTAALLLVTYLGFRVWIHNNSSYVEDQLSAITQSAEQSIAKHEAVLNNQSLER